MSTTTITDLQLDEWAEAAEARDEAQAAFFFEVRVFDRMVATADPFYTSAHYVRAHKVLELAQRRLERIEKEIGA